MSLLRIQCDLIQQLPLDFRYRALRLVAGKCTLAARIDSYGNAPSGMYDCVCESFVCACENHRCACVPLCCGYFSMLCDLTTSSSAQLPTIHTRLNAHVGENGKNFRELIEKRIEKWLEPPPKKIKKALRIPTSRPKRRRGGKRLCSNAMCVHTYACLYSFKYNVYLYDVCVCVDM